MTATTADMVSMTPPFARAHKALSSIMAQHGRARMAAWARRARTTYDITRTSRPLPWSLENVKLDLALLAGSLSALKRTGNSRKIARVRRRLDRILKAIAAFA